MVKKLRLEEISRRMDDRELKINTNFVISPNDFEPSPVGEGCYYCILLNGKKQITSLDVQNDFIKAVQKTGLFSKSKIWGNKTQIYGGKDNFPEKLFRNVYLTECLPSSKAEIPPYMYDLLRVSKITFTGGSWILSRTQKPTWIHISTENNHVLPTISKITKNELLKAYADSLKRKIFGGEILSKKQELIYYIKQELDWYKGWHHERDRVVDIVHKLGLEKDINLTPYTKGKSIACKMMDEGFKLLREKKYAELAKLMEKYHKMIPEILN